LAVALAELKGEKQKVFIVTDKFLYENNYTKNLEKYLDEMGIRHTTFFDVRPDPTLANAHAGVKAMRDFAPDCVLAFGGGSPIDAAKIMWVLYEHPEINFHDLAMRFMDIRKRVYAFPKMGEKANFIAVPTTAGSGSEVTPFAVITDEETGIKYPLADYALLPNMAIIDIDYMMDMPPGLTAASGIDVLTHALEAYASMLATDCTGGMALTAIRSVFDYLPIAYSDGKNEKAREKMADASTVAGMAFANAFLGVCHSMAHKLGAAYDLAHGVANALMINEVIRFNAAEKPTKQGVFSQYPYPNAVARYAEIADYLRLTAPDCTNEAKIAALTAKIDELKQKIGIHPSIRDYGINEADFLAKLDDLAEKAFDDQCTGANPRYPLMAEIKEMYLNAYYGK
jgi:acetaldehyde dehydrogenase/alcohol dehydrogenase